MPTEPEKRFTVSFSMENAAFNTRSPSLEIMRILDHIRGHVATGRFSGPLYDLNGNKIGEFLSVWRKDPPDPG